MNLAHVHLILNHVPLMTMPVALIFLLYGLWKPNTDMKRFALFILVLTAASALPVYFTGEPAEKIVKHWPGVAKALIEDHEEAAEISLIITMLAGALSALALFAERRPCSKKLIPLVTVACLAAVGSLAYTANLGGKIRHPEISNPGPAQAPSAPASNETEKHEHD
ncbi:MAG: hypothetical protein KF865_03475 [Bdellovibrionaceae bacterium]|nr:hypothetical protein [Pseudobdellovibrionaceae bacterium]